MTISSEMTVQCLSGMIQPSIILVKTGEKLKEKKSISIPHLIAHLIP